MYAVHMTSELRIGGVYEISELSGLTRQALNERARDRTWGFPGPIATLRGGRVWDLDVVESKLARRLGHRGPAVAPRENYPELGGVWEVAQLAGRPKPVVCNWSDRGTKGFPVALASLKLGRVWDMTQVRDWVRQHQGFVGVRAL